MCLADSVGVYAAPTGVCDRAAPRRRLYRGLQRVAELSRPLHFGDHGGLPLKLLWALLDVATSGVRGSGAWLWVAQWARHRF